MTQWLVLYFCSVLCCCSGYRLTSCGSDGKVDVDEFRPTVLTCTGITEDTVTWNISRYDGTNLTVATCTWPTSDLNCRHIYNGFDVERTDYTTSTLTVSLNGNRDGYRGAIQCGGPTVQSDSDTCNMRIVYPADAVTNCSVSVDSKDWTVTARCEVDKMFASDGHYACHWTLPTDNGNVTRAGSLSTTSFTENGTVYRRGVCVVRGVAITTADGVHSYTVTIDPGVTPLSGPSLQIKQPGNPTLVNCPDFIKEGGDVSCACQASSSRPPAVVTWYPDLPNLVRVLRLNNVNSSTDGTIYTCTQYWGGQSNSFLKRVRYTLRVLSLKTTRQGLTTSTRQDGIDTRSTPRMETTAVHVNSGDDVTNSGSSQAVAGGVGGGVAVVVVVVVVIVVIVIFKRQRGTKQKTSSPSPEEPHTYVNQASVHNHSSHHNHGSLKNEDGDLGNYTDIISNVDASGPNVPAVGGESTYELPTRRSQVVNSNIYTGLHPQPADRHTLEGSAYDQPARRSQIVDSNVYTRLSPQPQHSTSQEINYEIL